MPDKPRTLLAFDFGRRRIGVAVGQELTRTVTPLTTLAAVKDKPDWEAITRLFQQWKPALVVLGLPLNQDGSEHELTIVVRRFGNQLQGRYNVPVELVDERLSSYAAEEILRERGVNPRQHKAEIDKIAAQLILQGWLEQQGTA